jgi:ATP-binding cassette subfamily B protein
MTPISRSRPTWWYLSRLIAFLPHFQWPNCFSITMLLVLEAVPGLVVQRFLNGLPSDEPFLWLIAILLGAGLAQMAFLLGCQLTNGPFMLTNAALLQKNLLARVLALPGARALPASAGEAVSRFRDDVDDASGYMMGVNDLVGFLLFGLVALVMLVSVDWLLTLAVFVPLALVIALVNAARDRLEVYRRASREATAAVTGFLGETMGAVQAIQVSAAEPTVIGRFEQLNRRRLWASVRDRTFDALLQSISRNTVNLGTGAVLLLAGTAMRGGTFTVGDLALFVYYLGWVAELTTHLGRMLAGYRQLGVSLDRMILMLKGAPEESLVRHGPVYTKGLYPDVPQPTKSPVDRLELLEVRGLTHNYDDARGITDVSFTLRRNTFTVITGKIGSGKTTLLQTLLGLLPKHSGEVLWNGHPVDVLEPPRCAYTPQVPRLFSESLRDNVLLGLERDDAAVERALHLAVMERDLAEMPHGLATPVGPKGVRLSGGQIQRAAAARMFVRDAELLVFDDLSSALDVETERVLWERVFAERNATILAVSHRPAVIARADQVIVLEDGRVADIRTASQLDGPVTRT